jgi:PAS domain S-box-containing protein
VPSGTATDGHWDANAHLDAVLDSLVDHAVIGLDLGGRIASWNKGAERTKGYSAGEAIGRHFSCFYLPEDREAGLPGEVLALAAANGRHEAEGWRLRKDGSRFWASVVVQRLLDRDGVARGFVKVTRDATERKEMEKLREELHHAQKLEMVGQLTGGLAHDFNNLLTAIDASYQLVRHYAQDERIERVLEVNRVAIDRSKKLIAQLLAFSRKQTLVPKPSDINQLVLVFDYLLERSVGDSVRLRWDLQPDLPMVACDQGQLQSVLLNLVVNARDAMPAGGELTVFTEAVHLTASSVPPPHAVPDGQYVVLGVRDTGTGMPPDVWARAIEPFFTTKEVGKGSGLGLSQCYGFARQSGGTLTIETEEGAGTTVRVILPAGAQLPAARTADGGLTILLVDDDAPVRTLMSEALRLHGYTVIEAEDAGSALDHLRREVPIDCLFTDIIMPGGMNGLELVKAARGVRPALPSLLASGYPRDVLRGLARLPDDTVFLPKPYSINDLIMQVSGLRMTGPRAMMQC